MTYQTSTTVPETVIQRQFLDADSTEDYRVTMLTAHTMPDRQQIIVSLSNHLVLNGKPYDSESDSYAQASITKETALALIATLQATIDKL